jgi:hypothetical protein
MPDYKNGKIYKLVSPSGLTYIGATTQALAVRKAEHKRKYKQYAKGEYGFRKSFRLFEEDVDNIDIVLIEKYPCDCTNELYSRERFWMENTDCVNLLKTEKEKKNTSVRKSVKTYQQKTKSKVARDREIHKSIMRKQYEKNKEAKKQKMKEYYEKNMETRKQKMKAYYSNNKDRFAENQRKYLLKKKLEKEPGLIV